MHWVVHLPLLARVTPNYQRFFATMGQADTLSPSRLLPAATLLFGLSPKGEEGLSSCVTTCSCVLPPLPRRVRKRISARVSVLGAAFASRRVARHPGLCSRGLRGVRYLRPTRLLPSPRLGLSGGLERQIPLCVRSPASWFLTPFHGGICTHKVVTLQTGHSFNEHAARATADHDVFRLRHRPRFSWTSTWRVPPGRRSGRAGAYFT